MGFSVDIFVHRLNHAYNWIRVHAKGRGGGQVGKPDHFVDVGTLSAGISATVRQLTSPVE